MKAIQTGNKYTIFDDSVKTYDSLPAGTYSVCFHPQEGCYLMRRSNIVVIEKAYGIQRTKVDKVFTAFTNSERSLGVILSGDKGIGKSMFAKMVCERAVQQGIPVLIVDACVPRLANFIESINQECVVLFDEFEKIFRNDDDKDDQVSLLSLFDGTAGGKKLFMVTCNELYGLNQYIMNRPGRFHYHFRFDYPEPEAIREYLTDKLNPAYYGEIQEVVNFSRRTSLNYDCLRAISFELNSGTNFKEAISDLNIMTTENEEYRVYLQFDNGRVLHNFHFRTNLYDIDIHKAGVDLYDDEGRYILTAFFVKNRITYDVMTAKVIAPSDAVSISSDDIKDIEQAEVFKKAKPTYMQFVKAEKKSLHYKL